MTTSKKMTRKEALADFNSLMLSYVDDVRYFCVTSYEFNKDYWHIDLYIDILFSDETGEDSEETRGFRMTNEDYESVKEEVVKYIRQRKAA